MKKLTNEEFINKCNLLHNNLYDYSLVNYVNANSKIKIICQTHGVFEQLAATHLNGSKCNKCVRNILTQSEFILLANKQHNNTYDYSNINFTNMRNKISIICKIHGVFNQEPRHHLVGRGCPNCAIVLIGNKNKLSNDIFIEKAKLKHCNIYDYSLCNYNLTINKIQIICKNHGIFYQTPANHLKGHGCPYCKKSNGEKTIGQILINMNIKFIKEKIFYDCKDIRPLPFDFYLPDYNISIEYDGEQHFISLKHWGGDAGLVDRQKKDNIKDEYCKKNNIYLIRIKYNDNIKNKLLDLLNYF